MKTFDRDPVGKAVWDQYMGKRGNLITVYCDIAEDDVLPVDSLFTSETELSDLEQKALDLCTGKVLDAGAGAGRMSFILQQKGFEVKAIDVSKGAVSLMKARGLNAECIDIFDLKGEKFDTILMMMNGIGIVGTLQGLGDFLEHAKTLLNPGGQIIMESADINYMYEEEDGSFKIELGRDYYGEVKYQMEYRDQLGEWFDWLYLDIETLEEYSEHHGYECEIVAENTEGKYIARLLLS